MNLTATEIMKMMEDKYSSCSSYADRVYVEFADINGKRLHCEFRTEFLRPDYLNFEWQSYSPADGKSEAFNNCLAILFSHAGASLIKARLKPSWQIRDIMTLH